MVGREKVEVIPVWRKRRVTVVCWPLCDDLHITVGGKVLQKEPSLPVFINDSEDVLAVRRNGRLNGFASIRHPRDRKVLEWRGWGLRLEEGAQSVPFCYD